ncbi:DUF6223 family protein [Nonomuraea composti]|nr:DUF6223 family protein [Nonomuraea sp. FMUSA5-5]
MSVLSLLAATDANLLAQPEPVAAYSMTSGRLWSLVAALLGVVGVVAGGLALTRARRTGGGSARTWSVAALATGVAGAVIGAVVVAAAKGGPGTGYGIVGGYLAVLVGLAATAVGGLALTRLRHRTTTPTSRT